MLDARSVRPISGAHQTVVYEQYVELLKRAVTGYLYVDEDRQARRFSLETAGNAPDAPPTAEQAQTTRREGLDWPGIGYSMCGFKRLENLEYCLRTAVTNGVPGDFIETGVWRGGACIFAAGVLHALGQRNRTVWVADSFKGLPPPDAVQYPKDTGSTFHKFDELRVPREKVARAFELFGFKDLKVQYIEGFFEQTLKTAPVKQLCVARLDGDMYSSTICALEALYPKISPGGFIIIDDYYIGQCKAAVTDFRAEHGIKAKIVPCDWTGVYWQVPGP
nr:TylF/MycF/NovP-related O-methyltransferase [Panacagrimonas sp.]